MQIKSASKSLITPSIDMLVAAPGDHGKAMARSIKIAAIAAVSVCGSAAIAANFNLAVARSLMRVSTPRSIAWVRSRSAC